MGECYYHWCKSHCLDEPLCCWDKCGASEEQLKKFEEMRRKELGEKF